MSIRNELLENIVTGSSGILAGSLAISAGLNPEKALQVAKFAYNPDVDTSDEEDVWSVGGTLVRLSTAEKIVVASTDVIDIIIRGVDNDYNLLTETLTLSVGATTTINEFLSVYSSQVAPDSAVVNAANITGTAEVAGDVQFRIDAGNGQTEMCHYVVPDGHTAFLNGLHSTSSRNDDAIIRLQLSVDGAAYIAKYVNEISDASPPVTFGGNPVAIGEKTWVRFRAQGKTVNTRVSVNYQLVLYANEYLAEITKGF